MGYQGAEICTKQNGVLKQINLYSYCIIVTSQTQNSAPASLTGPRLDVIAPICLLGALVAPTDYIDNKLFFYIDYFQNMWEL